MPTLLQDLKFSFRVLAKAPGFTAAAILVLALGIGVNTAIFSLVHELVFSPRPWPAEKQVVQLYTQNEKNPQQFRMFSYQAYRQIRQQQMGFTDVLAHNLTMVGVGDGETARRTFGALVSSNYFSTLQVPLIRGRGFLPAEEKPGAAEQVTIVSYNYWKRLGFPADLVGRVIRVNERPYTVVGIAPEGFSGTMMLFGPELYFPLGCFEQLNNDFDEQAGRSLEKDDAYRLFLVGRLNPGQTMAKAEPGLKALAAQLKTAFPVQFKEQTLTARALPRLSTSNAPTEENSLSVLGVTLISMAGIVLLIASLNLANMLLARGTARRKEFAIRLALGGGRARIVRQLLTEGFVLALAGGLGGFVLGTWSTSLLMQGVGAMAPVGLFFQGATNPALFAATFGFCALATVLFALGPALKLSRTDVLTDLKESAGEDAARPRRWRWLPRHPLVVVQLALSLGLLTSAGLFIRGALTAAHVETGFKADDSIVIELDASLGGYDQKRSLPLYRATGERLAALPGVQSASIASIVPFGFINISRDVQRGGSKPAPDAKPANAAEGLAFNARWNSVGADYFTTVGLPVLRGRAFTRTESESPGAPAVAIIDEVLAKKLWPDGGALGQRIQFAERGAPKAAGGNGGSLGSSENIAKQAGDAPTLEVVGVVPATRWELFSDNPGGCLYVPFAQGFQSNVFFHVRTAPRVPGADAALFDTIRRELRTTAPGVPVLAMKTFRQHLDASLQLWITKVGAALFSVFGGLAMALAAVGLYGVKAYAVARRTREIGIRMALGAAPQVVQSMILREGLAMIATGVGAGLLLGLGLGQVLASLLYKVSPLDPLTFGLAPVLLSLVALLACWLPARRATRVNPLTALRSE
ncbi:MAG: ABC transporter permease [Opitutae bacterium]|nr:ABC transporter permease [Opitutae bacterium]